MKISTYAQSLMIQQRTETLQSRLFKANEQLASGKKASQFAELRAETSQTLTLRTKSRRSCSTRRRSISPAGAWR